CRTHCSEDIRRTVGSGQGGVTHCPRHHDRVFHVRKQHVKAESCFLDRVRTLQDHHATYTGRNLLSDSRRDGIKVVKGYIGTGNAHESTGDEDRLTSQLRNSCKKIINGKTRNDAAMASHRDRPAETKDGDLGLSNVLRQLPSSVLLV